MNEATNTSPRRAVALELFSALLEAPAISRLVQTGRDPETARYTLHFADGRTVRVGTIKTLCSQTELGRALAVAIDHVPPPVKREKWHDAIAALMAHAKEVQETPGESFEDTVRDWLGAYMGRASSDRDGAAAAGNPFYDNTHLYVRATNFATHLRREYSEQVKLHELRGALRELGAEQATIHVTKRSGRGERRTTVSYYRIPLAVLDGDEPEHDT